MRSTKQEPNGNSKVNKAQEDDLKWVEENVPSSVTDVALPALLDSDEERMITHFERSKMEQEWEDSQLKMASDWEEISFCVSLCTAPWD